MKDKILPVYDVEKIFLPNWDAVVMSSWDVTERVKIEQLECGLLKGGWSGMEREAVLGVKGHAHRVSHQRAEMGDECIVAHDAMTVG